MSDFFETFPQLARVEVEVDDFEGGGTTRYEAPKIPEYIRCQYPLCDTKEGFSLFQIIGGIVSAAKSEENGYELCPGNATPKGIRRRNPGAHTPLCQHE